MTRRPGRATMRIRASGATTMKRDDPSHLSATRTRERVIRAPRGRALSAKSWLTEAPLRMLMNNLDPEVAERPQDLVVYGGIGRAARNWACYDAIVAALTNLNDDESLLIQSGKPVGVFKTHPDAPRVLIANSNLVPKWATGEHFNDLDDALALIAEACAKRTPTSVGLLGNAAEVLPELVRRKVRPHLVTDQTSAHDLVYGYLPADWTVDRWRAAQGDPAQHAELTASAQRSIRTHVEAMLAFHAQGIPTVDYGNNIRQVAFDEGLADASAFPGFVPAYVRPLFCEGRGPFRWVALSGDPEDIRKTDRKVKELFPDDAALQRWLDLAGERIAFQGLPARICWLGLGQRHRAGLAFNELVASGEIKAPIVIGRDHLDTGSVASPNRETEGMKDGTDAVSDWPLLNALLNTAGGATWVSIHHGGGVGMGYAQHAGVVIVCDGTPAAAKRIERVLWNDPASGVMRPADAG